jgi:hypothetical protein
VVFVDAARRLRDAALCLRDAALRLRDAAQILPDAGLQESAEIKSRNLQMWAWHAKVAITVKSARPVIIPKNAWLAKRQDNAWSNQALASMALGRTIAPNHAVYAVAPLMAPLMAVAVAADDEDEKEKAEGAGAAEASAHCNNSGATRRFFCEVAPSIPVTVVHDWSLSN